MKKILSFFLLFTLLFAENTSAQAPEKIYGKNKVLKSNEYYLQQLGLWKKETEKDPKNADAWFNYYLANRNAYIVGEEGDSQQAKTVNRFERLKAIVDEMEKQVPETYEYNYVKWMNGNNDLRLVPYLEKANALQPTAPGPLISLAYYYEIKGEYAKKEKCFRDYYALGDYSPGLLNYAYNMLAELDSNAIIFTHGDKDTDATFILQAAKNIRPDVRLINVDLFMIKEYRQRLFKELEIPGEDIDPFLGDKNYERFRETIIEQVAKNSQKRPVYVGVLVAEPYTGRIKDKLYLTGLSYLLSAKKVDNFALLKRNYEERYALDYLKTYLPYDLSEGNMHAFNANYLLSLAALRDFYTSSKLPEKAAYYNDLAIKIANDTGHPWDFQQYFNAK